MRARNASWKRLLLLLVAAAVLLAGGFPRTPSSAADSCPNESRRVEQEALSLPDCRAYELVTPGVLIGGSKVARAAAGGGAITYYTTHPAPDASTSSFYYVARRDADGWSSQDVGEQDAAASRYSAACEQNVFFSPELSSNVLELGLFDPTEPRCSRPEEPVVAGEPEPYRNIFLHDIASGSTELLNLTPEGATPANAKFQDASPDFSHIVFSEEAQLTPDAPPGNDFYLWSGGVVQLLTFLPDGTPAPGELVEALPGSGFAPFTGAMSSDGRSIFFYSGGKLYLRENADQPQSAVVGGECAEPARACTIEVDASQGPGASGGGAFWRATTKASAVFFTDESRLTPDSTAEAGKPDLYRYDRASGDLTDLTASGGEPADVRGISGMSEDGSFIYFVANGVLASGASPGSCLGPIEPGQTCNLYVFHEGSIHLVDALSRANARDWQEFPGDFFHKSAALSANVSPDGGFLAFRSGVEISLYNASANGGEGALSCVSCAPGPVLGSSSLATAGNYGPTSFCCASWMAHAVLDDGSVFFTSSTPLLSQDTNEHTDVYEFRGGELRLISPGNFAGDATFLDASANGSDVFFRTPQPLAPQDTDNENVSIYDARVDGGFAAPSPPAPPCEGEGCRGPLEPAPTLPLPGTVKHHRHKKHHKKHRHKHRHKKRHRQKRMSR